MKGPKMTLSDSMLAMEISAPGGPDVLRPVSLPVPVPGQGHIVIRLAFVGVNRPDALQRAGNYAPPPSASPLPGLGLKMNVAWRGSEAPVSDKDQKPRVWLQASYQF